MIHRAVIYIRTSSETQGGKSSPSEQEGDCQTLAKEKGLQVVRVYRNVEKYRRDIQVEFRAKIMDLAVSKQILDFPNGGEIVVRL